MTREEWFSGKFRWLKRFFFVSIAGLICALLGAFAPNETLSSILVVLGLLAIIPLIFMLCFIPILHWKDRYVGSKSNVWGAFLVFETSGWTKIFYWFVHVLPDKGMTGQYANID